MYLQESKKDTRSKFKFLWTDQFCILLQMKECILYLEDNNIEGWGVLVDKLCC